MTPSLLDKHDQSEVFQKEISEGKPLATSINSEDTDTKPTQCQVKAAESNHSD